MVCVGGYLGTADAWDKFDEPWRAVLDGPPSIEYFKSSEAESLRPDGQWKGIKAQERDQRINTLIEVIGTHAAQPFCVRLQQKDYDEVIKPWVPPIWQNPYYFLLIGFLSSVTSTHKYLGGAEQIEFIFDSDDQNSLQFGSTRKLHRWNTSSIVGDENETLGKMFCGEGGYV